MITFKTVELDDIDTINSYLKNSPYKICDLFFPNIYIWMNLYHSQYAIVDNFLIILENNERFLMPVGTGDLKAVLQKLIIYANEHNIPLSFYAISRAMFQTLDQLFPNTFEIFMERDCYDYIYESKNLLALSGKKFQTKRNHINKFKKLYTYHIEKINDDNLHNVLSMHEAWCIENHLTSNEQALEKEAVRDALFHHQELGLDTLVLFVEDKVVAFSLGAPINQTTYDVLIEKAFIEYEGSYATINQLFIQEYCQNYKYINREDDLGIPGLRKAKLSYQPVQLLEKGSVYLKENKDVS